ncbi:group 1 glycosyl transferase [Pedobacter sp. HMWF019]|uniref:glycosyltransferase family 4 protein n=1 Tax=Pedobacter sp. HMWF019 TaxID=2056856 RepID=UPI000D36BAD5|nr:glycosyltransferase family 4 protein [Pedobacter sp. HMWF019]PTT02663.1 group 1 glycosyl transferase [Pedobacter sp. HMWF019]
MKILISHPTGNQFVRAMLQALQEDGFLAGFYTTFALSTAATWPGWLPGPWQTELSRRSYNLQSARIHTRPGLELLRNLLPKFGLKHFVRHEKGFACLDRVYQDLDQSLAAALPKLVSKSKIDAVYAYEDAALKTFKAAKKLGVKCIYDLPIAYWETGRKLMEEEARRLPAWAATLGGGIYDSETKLQRKKQELELADVVVVPGDFVLHSLPEWAAGKKVIVSPFGSPKPVQLLQNKSVDRPLRILFAGSMGQRKGLADLFAAVEMLGPGQVELVIMGSLQAPLSFYKTAMPDFTYERSRPHDQVLKLMQSCDVFCLPSIVEGRALVMQEAMSQGLPLLITPNTGGSDLVLEGQTGFCVPIRSPAALAEKLQWYIDHREHTREMGKQAANHAALYTWEKYADHIIKQLIDEV